MLIEVEKKIISHNGNDKYERINRKTDSIVINKIKEGVLETGIIRSQTKKR